MNLASESISEIIPFLEYFILLKDNRHWDCIYFDSPVLDRNQTGRNGSKNREEVRWKRSNGFPLGKKGRRFYAFARNSSPRVYSFRNDGLPLSTVTKARTSSASLDRNCEWNIVHDVVNDDND